MRPFYTDSVLHRTQRVESINAGINACHRTDGFCSVGYSRPSSRDVIKGNWKLFKGQVNEVQLRAFEEVHKDYQPKIPA